MIWAPCEAGFLLYHLYFFITLNSSLASYKLESRGGVKMAEFSFARRVFTVFGVTFLPG